MGLLESSKINYDAMQESARKADIIAGARRAAGMSKMMITQKAQGADDTPERILLDWASKNPEKLLGDYNAHMADFCTVPIDPDGNTVRLYRGEWSILSGFPGTGKTTFLKQMVCHFLLRGECVFVATLEQDPEHYIIELAGVAAGVEIPNEAQLTSFIDTYGEKLKVWGIIGIAEHKQIFATVRNLADKENCRHAIIDSLMALDIESDDYEGQRKFANLVSATSRAKRVHIYLVAHPKKPIAADADPNIWDVAGSSDLGRLAFNVFFIRRGPQVPGFEHVSNMLFHVLKQRTRGKIGDITGFFYPAMRQFRLSQMETDPMHYLPDTMYTPDGMNDDIPLHKTKAFEVERAPMPAFDPTTF